MPTADVYRRFDAMGLGREQDLLDEPDWEQWTKLKSADLLPRLVNDLEQPALDISPQLSELRREHEKLLGRIVRMSGSGSSLFTLFDEEAEAKDASARLSRSLGGRALAVEVSPNFTDDLNTEFAVG
jgi:4-diphosphocytidyl-2-C-methyl-D-erythritol kinase